MIPQFDDEIDLRGVLKKREDPAAPVVALRSRSWCSSRSLGKSYKYRMEKISEEDLDAMSFKFILNSIAISLATITYMITHSTVRMQPRLTHGGRTIL